MSHWFHQFSIDVVHFYIILSRFSGKVFNIPRNPPKIKKQKKENKGFQQRMTWYTFLHIFYYLPIETLVAESLFFVDNIVFRCLFHFFNIKWSIMHTWRPNDNIINWTIPVVNISTLKVLLAFDPALDVDIWHFFSSKESVVFQDDVICVPNDAAQFVSGRRKISSRVKILIELDHPSLIL